MSSNLPRLAEEIRARLRLSERIGNEVKLVRRGRNIVGLCPFHEEKTPSFTVDDEKGFYHCFGCGAHGSIIDFVMAREGRSFTEAVTLLAPSAGLEVPARDRKGRERAEVADRQRSLLARAETWFIEQLHKPSGAKALAYLRGRGLSEATIGQYRLGYAPAGPRALLDALSAHCDEASLFAAGLARARDGDKMVRDFFRNRVMFPIHDRSGKPIAFAGRILEENGYAPKYLNSPETALFRKGRELFGLPQARAAIRRTRRCVLVEGYMDALSLCEGGIAEATSICGTALGGAQLALAWRDAETVTLCFDGDEAGRKAARRALEVGLEHLVPGRRLAFCTLPPGEDPDTLVRSRGPEAMRELLAAATPMARFLWESYLEATPGSQPEDRAALRAQLRAAVRRIKDPDLAREYARDISLSWSGQFGESGFASGSAASASPRKDSTTQWAFGQGYRTGFEDGRGGIRLDRSHELDGTGTRTDDRRRAYRAGYDLGHEDARQKAGNRMTARLRERTISPAQTRRDRPNPLDQICFALVRMAADEPGLIHDDPECFAAIEFDNPGLEALRDKIIELTLAEKNLDRRALHKKMGNEGVFSRLDDLSKRYGQPGTHGQSRQYGRPPGQHEEDRHEGREQSERDAPSGQVSHPLHANASPDQPKDPGWPQDPDREELDANREEPDANREELDANREELDANWRALLDRAATEASNHEAYPHRNDAGKSSG